MINWQIKAGRGGVCDFRKNYDFYFKWLTNKVMSCFIVSGTETDRTRSIDWDYAKMNLILDGEICITDFDNKLYACIGARGGAPNEYYIPTRFVIANPILGSKEVKINEDGVVIFNSKIDKYMYTSTTPIFATGLCDLIEQTATLLSDNIISINCVQVNARVNTFFTADSEAQASAGEGILKKMYAGTPYQILRSDLIDKINVNPVNTSATGQNITELVELHNYIIANFFQSIGIKSNNIMKRERLIRDEIESQDDFLQVSILEMLAAWKDGLDRVNDLYGTDFEVKLNPVLLNELMEQLPAADGKAAAEPAESEAVAEPAESEAAAEPAETLDLLEDQEETVKKVVDMINDNEKGEEEDVQQLESGTENDEPNDS